MKSIPFDEEEKNSIILYDNDKGYKSNLYPFTELKETTIDDFRIRFTSYDKRFYFVLKDVYVKFKSKRPSASASAFYNTNKDKFLPGSFAKFEFSTPGGKQKLLVATFDIISWICSRANTDLGDSFRLAVGKLHQKLVEGELSLLPSQEAITLFLHEQQFKTHLLEKQLDQLTSAVKHNTMVLEQNNTLVNQFQINSQTEKPAVPESGTISYKLKSIKSLIKDTARREGVHFNKICNEFKKIFQLRSYTVLEKKDYNKTIAWFNARQDQLEEQTSIQPAYSKLDEWIEENVSTWKQQKKEETEH